MVVEIPHAGITIDPLSARYTVLPDEASRAGALEADSDVGADRLWHGSEVARVVARTSRYVIDLNTEPRFPTPYQEKLPAPLREVMHRSESGVRWRAAPPPRPELERRVAEIFEPYHAAVAGLLERARERHGMAFLLSAHTYPDRGRGADLVIGTRHGEGARPELRARLAAVATRFGLSVALEEPFPGGYAVARHGRPADGVMAVQLELARRLVQGDDGLAKMSVVMHEIHDAAEAWAR